MKKFILKKYISGHLFGVALYPLLIPIWQKTPLLIHNTKFPPPPLYLTYYQLNTQCNLYPLCRDARLRIEIIRTLAASNNPMAIPLLKKILKTEENEIVREEIIRAFYSLRKVVPLKNVEFLKPWFSHGNPSMRGYAFVLYILNAADISPVAYALKNEKSEIVLELVWNTLRTRPYLCLKSSSLFLSSDETSSEINKTGIAWLKAFSLGLYQTSELPIVRYFCLKGLMQSRKKSMDSLLTRFINDKNPSVRCLLASLLPATEKRIGILLQLVEDRDEEVRRIACISLGKAREDTKRIADVLLKHCADKAFSVRVAAEKAFINLPLPKDSKVEKLKKVMSLEAYSPSLVKISGLLRLTVFENKITAILETYRTSRLKEIPYTKRSIIESYNSLEQLLDIQSRTLVVKRAIYTLSRLNSQKASPLIACFANYKDYQVRRLVANALGYLKSEPQYQVLVRLSKDSNIKVAVEAIKAMGITRSRSFNSILLQHARNVRAASDIRASACWSLARIGVPNKKIITWLNSLCSKRVIPAEGMTMYDSNYVRASACLALAEMGKKYKECKETAKAKLEELNNPFADAEFVNAEIREFFRQIKAYMENKKQIYPNPIPETQPNLPVIKLIK